MICGIIVAVIQFEVNLATSFFIFLPLNWQIDPKGINP
jgi:hypothetical protein